MSIENGARPAAEAPHTRDDPKFVDIPDVSRMADMPDERDYPFFLKMADVVRLTTLSRSTLDRLVKEDRFPAPVQVTDSRKAWVLSEVIDWQVERISSRSAA